MFVEKLWFSIAIFHSENFDFWKVRFYNCFICDLNLIARFLSYVVVVSCFSYVNHRAFFKGFPVGRGGHFLKRDLSVR